MYGAASFCSRGTLVECKSVKLILVLSDLHIGTGHRKGQLNVFDDFREDGRFEQLLRRYTTGAHEKAEVDLVLNGDIYDLLKVPVNGVFPELITERLAVMKIEQCVKGHPRLIKAMSAFLANGKNRITYQPGNHDMEFFFPRVQRLFCRAITGEDTHPRVRFISEEPSFTLEGGVQFHHGHQFEAVHAVDMKKLFLTRGVPEPVLNLPWGSLFILQVINKLTTERPYLDKVYPFWPMIAGGLMFDTRFTAKLLAHTVYYYAKARLNPVWWQKRPFEKLGKFLRQDVRFFDHLDNYASRLLRDPAVNAIFMGHTHNEMVRTYPRGKVYVNTGTWMPMVNLQLANFGHHQSLHYGFVKYLPDGKPRASLMRWHGKRPISEEVIF
jgi:UDP-2,3-diacylglucosamine pyrophosphatase LpxH